MKTYNFHIRSLELHVHVAYPYLIRSFCCQRTFRRRSPTRAGCQPRGLRCYPDVFWMWYAREFVQRAPFPLDTFPYILLDSSVADDLLIATAPWMFLAPHGFLVGTCGSSLLLRFGEFVADSARRRYFSWVVPGNLLGHLSRGLASQERLA